MSRDMAMNSLRKFSACLDWVLDSSRLVSLVTPSTSSAISAPNMPTTSSLVDRVSSIVSCSSAVTMVASSRRISVRMAATAMGW